MATKKMKAAIGFFIALALLAASAYFTKGIWYRYLPAGLQKGKQEQAKGAECKEVYVCPMHPQVIRDRPADCPICGMSLIKKELPQEGAEKGGMPGMPGMTPEEHAAQADASGLGRVTLDPRQVVLANVAATEVVHRDISQEIATVGKIAVDEQLLRRVTARYGGRIERLTVNFTGQYVKKGQLIYSIYSPELLSTQKEYLIAKQSAERLKSSEFAEIARGSEGVLDAARTRMRLWGMSDAQIARLDETGDARPVVDVYSPVSGTVMEIKMRQGDYVMEGGEIYTVADLSRVWMLADVYEYEFSKVGMGSPVEVTAEAYPGKVFRGKVSFIEPTVNSESRTVTVRVELNNAGGILKPDMFVNARIYSRPAHGLVIPASSILYTGNRDIAWVEVEPGVYERREVKLGLRSGDFYQVLSGLSEGEKVVSQGGFLIDSEAQLRESAGGMAGMPGMEMGGEGSAPAPSAPQGGHAGH